MKNTKARKVWFIIFICVFTLFWVLSLLGLFFSIYLPDVATSIQTALNWSSLITVSFWVGLVSTAGLIITLLWKQIYNSLIR